MRRGRGARRGPYACLGETTIPILRRARLGANTSASLRAHTLRSGVAPATETQGALASWRSMSAPRSGAEGRSGGAEKVESESATRHRTRALQASRRTFLAGVAATGVGAALATMWNPLHFGETHATPAAAAS